MYGPSHGWLSEAGELGPNWKNGADKFLYFLPPELDWGTTSSGSVAAGWGGGDSLYLNRNFWSNTCGHVSVGTSSTSAVVRI